MCIKKKIFLLCLIYCVLSACASVPSQQGIADHKMTWSARQTQLAQIKQWQLTGAVGIITPQGANSASINWQLKNQQYYNLSISGPLGSASANLTAKPNAVSLKTSDGKHYQAANAQQLIYQVLGWRLPVNDMYYWIRGIPTPAANQQQRFDKYNHLIQLRQHNWLIKYLAFTSVNGIDLPSKLQLTSKNFKVKLIIKHWTI